MLKTIKPFLILFINIVVFLILFSAIYYHNQCLPTFRHDAVSVFSYNWNALSHFAFPRVIPYSIARLYNVILPAVFNLHPADFKVNYFVCGIVSFLYMLYIWIISKNFYFWEEKLKPCILRKDFCLVLFFSFLFSSYFLFGFKGNVQPILLGTEDSLVFLEYLGGYFLFFLFYTFLFKFVFKNERITVPQKILYPIIGVIIGCWSEFININTFISYLIMLFLIYFYDKNKLKEKTVWLMFAGIITGLFIFYIVSGNFNPSHCGTLGNYSILSGFIANIPQIPDLTKNFIQLYFKDYIAVWSILISLSVLITNTVPKEDKRKIIFFMLANFALILGFLIYLYFAAFFITKEMRGLYIFDLCYFTYVGYIVCLFIMFNLCGIISSFTHKFCKIILLTAFCIFSVFVSLKFIPQYKDTIKYLHEERRTIYNYEKYLLIHSVYNEYLSINPFLQDFSRVYNSDTYTYTTLYNICDDILFSHVYKNKKKGIILTSVGNPEERLEQREQITGKIEDKYNLFHVILFAPLKQYDNFSFTLKKIDELQKSGKSHDLLNKEKAYLYIEQSDFQKASDLLGQYTKRNPQDTEALIQLAKLYKNQKLYNKELAIYNGLLNKFPDNIVLLFDISAIYYEQNNCKKALEINKHLLDLINADTARYEDLVSAVYYNNLLIYRKMKDEAKVREMKETILGMQDSYWVFATIGHNVVNESNIDNSDNYIDSDVFKSLFIF